MLTVAKCKMALLMEMLNREGEITLNDDARQGLYDFLSDINESLAAANMPIENQEGGE